MNKRQALIELSKRSDIRIIPVKDYNDLIENRGASCEHLKVKIEDMEIKGTLYRGMIFIPCSDINLCNAFYDHSKARSASKKVF